MVAADSAIRVRALEPEEMVYKGMSDGACVFLRDNGTEWPMAAFYYLRQTN